MRILLSVPACLRLEAIFDPEGSMKHRVDTGNFGDAAIAPLKLRGASI
jgi:hypothetical protein